MCWKAGNSTSLEIKKKKIEKSILYFDILKQRQIDSRDTMLILQYMIEKNQNKVYNVVEAITL